MYTYKQAVGCSWLSSGFPQWWCWGWSDRYIVCHLDKRPSEERHACSMCVWVGVTLCVHQQSHKHKHKRTSKKRVKLMWCDFFSDSAEEKKKWLFFFTILSHSLITSSLLLPFDLSLFPPNLALILLYFCFSCSRLQMKMWYFSPQLLLWQNLSCSLYSL